MRILNLSAQKPDSTGSGVYLAQTVRCQLDAGHTVAVVCGLGANDGHEALDPRAQVWPVRFDTPELPFSVCGMSDVMPYAATRYRDLTPAMQAQWEAAFSARLQQVLREFRPDVVLCHHLYLLMALVREQVRDLPVAAVCHSTELRQLSQHGLARERIAQAARQLDAVLCLHQAQAEQVQRQLGVASERLWVVGTGYDDRLFRPGAEPPQPRSLLYVGKVCEAKGALSLLRALKLLAAQGQAPSLLRVAGGWGQSAGEKDAAQCLANACGVPVEFLGRVRPEELARLYRASEVFVLPSFFEGLPLVLVEAMACGCKAVATDLPGVRGWLCGQVPDAPVRWVAPPAMADVDKPQPGQLPAFEQALARALAASLDDPAPSVSLTPLAWERVSARILEALAQSAAGFAVGSGR